MLSRNLIANFVRQGWATLMGVAFGPVYVSYLDTHITPLF